ncbi:DUF2332 domain-containing protein [Microbacterium allomyrinae]|uniref:DUF2332 domain-containing protein n=1 Tax=Microbacterium allomyrinae TaxID=2830666 RepID=A0A9X1LX90_9MICO|nr:DUF2332 domain-containing protein [Microbacterium allomyrinae]MCC2033481.1 DUF2332 domain-containing protein [Microbacterium allomyrinae]
MSTTDDAARVAAFYDDFGRRWAHGTSPLYEEWALGIAADPALIARIAALSPRLRQPNILFAAARWAGCPLATFAAWQDWLDAHWDEVVEIAGARSTQTNEPNRCATLLPPLTRIDGPVALLEVGTAAGLCLFPDRYGYDFDAPGGPRTLEPVEGPSPVRLSCRVDDDASVPARLPEVAWRRGIDLSPIDASDPEAVDWLATLVWPGPDHDSRVARLRAAAKVAASDPPDIVQGDLLETVTDVAATAPADATLVVFHSAVLLYLDAAGRARFAEIMAGLGSAVGRDVVWLSNETLGTFSDVDAQVPAGLDTAHRFVQTRDKVPIALAGQHGAVYETRPFRG